MTSVSNGLLTEPLPVRTISWTPNFTAVVSPLVKFRTGKTAAVSAAWTAEMGPCHPSMMVAKTARSVKEWFIALIGLTRGRDARHRRGAGLPRLEAERIKAAKRARAVS